MTKIYKKKTSLGAWVKKGEDIKDGDLIIIANEGVEDDSGDFGTRQVFMVKLINGEEKNLAFNQTSINNMIDAFGEQAINWIGKQVKVWMVKQNVAGKFLQVLYVSHPQAEFGENGFILDRTPGMNELSLKDEIPVINNDAEYGA